MIIFKRLDILFCPILGPSKKKKRRRKQQLALHLCFNIKCYVSSWLFAWLGQTQEDISLRHIPFPGMSGGVIYVWNLYSGNKTHNTGMDQVVPWCNLWIIPIKCRCLSKTNLVIKAIFANLISKKRGKWWPVSINQLRWEVYEGFLWFQLVLTMQSQWRCNFISKLAQSG